MCSFSFPQSSNIQYLLLLFLISTFLASKRNLFSKDMDNSDSPTPTAEGRSNSCPDLKSISNKVGSMLCRCARNYSTTPNKYKRLDQKLERKMIELRQKTSDSGLQNKQFRSINSIIMKFPHLKEQVKNLRVVFEQLDEDCNGIIDREELHKCLKELQVDLNEQELDDLFHSCDVDKNGHIQFNEFIVLLCLIYLLTNPGSSSSHTVSRMGSPDLEATFDTIIQVFLYMDKNGDGKLNKKDMISALTEVPWERSPSHVTNSRFMEMDKDKDGNVSFREFLFGLTSWLGIDSDDEIPVTAA